LFALVEAICRHAGLYNGVAVIGAHWRLPEDENVGILALLALLRSSMGWLRLAGVSQRRRRQWRHWRHQRPVALQAVLNADVWSFVEVAQQRLAAA
jgi:hypothetical protein